MRAVIGGLMAGVFCGAVQATDLQVKVENLQSAKGKVIIELVNRQMYEAEDDPAVLQSQVVTTRVPAVSYTFRALPPGEYALRVIHDLNSNYELDSNAFTGPSEPFGVSRIQRADVENMPDWQLVKFTLNQTFSLSPVSMTVAVHND